MMANPACPVCGTNKRVQALAGKMFRCGKCGGLFDDDPDEGGDFHSRNPAARAAIGVMLR